MADVKTLLLVAIRAADCDGLVNVELSCGCGTDDFAPCDGIQPGCELAHLAPDPNWPDEQAYYPGSRTACGYCMADKTHPGDDEEEEEPRG